MNPPRVPNKTQMRRYLEKGLTQQQIADQWEEDSNVRVSRAAIGLAIARYGLQSSKPRKRYAELIPWKIRPEHRQHRDVKMLRLESRRREGLPLSEDDKRRLTNWKAALLDAEAVVYYHPETEQGFFWTPREEQDGDLVRQPE